MIENSDNKEKKRHSAKIRNVYAEPSSKNLGELNPTEVVIVEGEYEHISHLEGDELDQVIFTEKSLDLDPVVSAFPGSSVPFLEPTPPAEESSMPSGVVRSGASLRGRASHQYFDPEHDALRNDGLTTPLPDVVESSEEASLLEHYHVDLVQLSSKEDLDELEKSGVTPDPDPEGDAIKDRQKLNKASFDKDIEDVKNYIKGGYDRDLSKLIFGIKDEAVGGNVRKIFSPILSTEEERAREIIKSAVLAAKQEILQLDSRSEFKKILFFGENLQVNFLKEILQQFPDLQEVFVSEQENITVFEGSAEEVKLSRCPNLGSVKTNAPKIYVGNCQKLTSLEMPNVKNLELYYCAGIESLQSQTENEVQLKLTFCKNLRDVNMKVAPGPAIVMCENLILHPQQQDGGESTYPSTSAASPIAPLKPKPPQSK